MKRHGAVKSVTWRYINLDLWLLLLLFAQHFIHMYAGCGCCKYSTSLCVHDMNTYCKKNGALVHSCPSAVWLVLTWVFLWLVCVCRLQPAVQPQPVQPWVNRPSSPLPADGRPVDRPALTIFPLHWTKSTRSSSSVTRSCRRVLLALCPLGQGHTQPINPFLALRTSSRVQSRMTSLWVNWPIP